MTPLPWPNNLHLDAAAGWLELGNHAQANAELDHISPEFRTHAAVLELRWHICAADQQWPACVEIANALLALVPDTSPPWIHRSFALHELKRTQEAFDLLLPAVEKFPEIWTIPYNLACYCAQLGNLSASQDWLKKAMAVDEHTVKRAAVDDPDLRPLRDSMGGTLWQRIA